MSFTCREKSCGKPIVFAITRKGHRIPLDPDPVANGNIRLQRALDPTELPLAIEVAPGQGTHVSHFSTCTAPNRFRKEGRR